MFGIIKITLIFIYIFLGAFFIFKIFQSNKNLIPNLPNHMQITSSAFESNQNIPAKYTCDGEKLSPPLSISGVPEKSKSLVLICDDPDAPNGDFVHWLVWNIPTETTQIDEGQAPAGVEGTTSYNKTGYGSPCPPSGTHRYFFKIFALDTELDLDSVAKKSALLVEMKDHVLDQAETIGLYER
jgi:hypothetical protein